MAHKRICVVCGKEYEYCPTCGADRQKPSWMMSYHDNNCRMIWKVLSAVGAGQISKDEAAKQLNSLNTDIELKSNIRDHINKIFEKPYKEAPVVSEAISEAEKVDEIIEEQKEPIKSFKYNSFNKKNYK